MRTVLALVSTFALSCAHAPQQSPLGARLDALLTRYESQGYSGSVLVAKDGRIVLHKGYGFADRERGIRNEAETEFEVASITKTFTAAAILQLEERGKLRTSDLLSQHLGPFPAEKASATIEHLATHTAGLVPDGTDLGDGADREAFVEAVKNVPRESAPGEKYRYTNAGFSTLAAIVEKVSGQPFEQYVRENLFKRAGLDLARFRGEPATRRTFARGYLGAKESTPPPYRWGTRGSGGLIVTVGDLYRWYVALRGGRVLSQAQVEKMFAPRETEGYGWHVERDPAGRRRIMKGGGMPEYASQIIDYPDDRLLIIWTSNDLEKRWRQDLNRAIAAVAFGEEPPAK